MSSEKVNKGKEVFRFDRPEKVEKTRKPVMVISAIGTLCFAGLGFFHETPFFYFSGFFVLLGVLAGVYAPYIYKNTLLLLEEDGSCVAGGKNIYDLSKRHFGPFYGNLYLSFPKFY